MYICNNKLNLKKKECNNSFLKQYLFGALIVYQIQLCDNSAYLTHVRKWLIQNSCKFQIIDIIPISSNACQTHYNMFYNKWGLIDILFPSQCIRYGSRLGNVCLIYQYYYWMQHFRNLVIQHFHVRAFAILSSCRAYAKGVEVGCGVEVAKEKGSHEFRKNVKWYMRTLVGAFKEIGAENVDEFVPLVHKVSQKIRAFFCIHQ